VGEFADLFATDQIGLGGGVLLALNVWINHGSSVNERVINRSLLCASASASNA
jgi:hypothetical protein